MQCIEKQSKNIDIIFGDNLYSFYTDLSNFLFPKTETLKKNIIQALAIRNLQFEGGGRGVSVLPFPFYNVRLHKYQIIIQVNVQFTLSPSTDPHPIPRTYKKNRNLRTIHFPGTFSLHTDFFLFVCLGFFYICSRTCISLELFFIFFEGGGSNLNRNIFVWK